jgi:hypothetical protein
MQLYNNSSINLCFYKSLNIQNFQSQGTVLNFDSYMIQAKLPEVRWNSTFMKNDSIYER